LTLAAHVHISAATVVTKSIAKPGHYTGVFPVEENSACERNAATLKQLHRLRERIKALEKELEK
jgi:UDP-3-O-[3-hydroxymyristoyl] glucosamine N-acyltransferase